MIAADGGASAPKFASSQTSSREPLKMVLETESVIALAAVTDSEITEIIGGERYGVLSRSKLTYIQFARKDAVCAERRAGRG